MSKVTINWSVSLILWTCQGWSVWNSSIMHQIPHRQFATKFVTKFSYKKTRTLTNDSYNTAFYYPPPPLKKTPRGCRQPKTVFMTIKLFFFSDIFFTVNESRPKYYKDHENQQSILWIEPKIMSNNRTWQSNNCY